MVVLTSPEGAMLSETEFMKLLAAHDIFTESVFRRHEFNELIRFTKGTGVDVGCGLNKIHPGAIGVNARVGPKDFGFPFGAQLQGKAEHLHWLRNMSLDYVFSSHCLEHTRNPREVLSEWVRVIKPGGWLVLLLPHKDVYPRVGTPGANPDHKVDLGPEDLIQWLADLDLELQQIDTVRRILSGDPWATWEAPRWGHPTLNFSFEVVARKADRS